MPIHSVLPQLVAELRQSPRAVLVAPPGAGKTTGVPPALLGESWCAGQILLLVPRRLAARAAAEFMAANTGEQPGETFGYQTRLDSKARRDTRVIAMTHGVFLSRIQADPELNGVSAVLFDEVHERSLDNDLALALTLDAASALRPDLRILAMSATLDSERYSTLLGASVVESRGRAHPLEIIYPGRNGAARVEDQVARASRSALADHPGSLLAFLPGVAEIERTAEALGRLPEQVVVHRLHGGVDPREQRAALATPPPGTRKLVLATSIAETSVTVQDVRIVVDSGLARRPRYDVGAGLTRLVTERASQSAAAQRAGRAAREGPGVAIRMWEEAATGSLPAHDPPEILEADLSRLLLACLLWGEADPARLSWLDQPPRSALDEARARLVRLGAIGEDHLITAHGRAIAALPLEPRLAHMLIEGAAHGYGRTASEVAMLLTERNLGGKDPDIDTRLARWRADRSQRANAAREMARRWLKRVPATADTVNVAAGRAVALAFPDRLAKRRDASGETWQSVGGRGFRLDVASSLTRNEWLAVAEIAGRASGARIVSAASVEDDVVLDLFGDRVEIRQEIDFDPRTGGVTPTLSRRLGAIRLTSGPDPNPDPGAIEAALIDGLREYGLDLLPWSDAALQLRHRAAFASSFTDAIASLDEHQLLERVNDWLPPLLTGKRRLSEISESGLCSAVEALLGWEALRQLDRLAPATFTSPAGSTHVIDYATPGGPTVEVRAQALFGLVAHPMLADGRVRLTLAITSPAGRPIQTSRDLPSFWSGSWRDVAKEMRGRYPKHSWPDDPAGSVPTLRSKRAQGTS